MSLSLMDFILCESELKKTHGIYVGRMQPPTIAHGYVIEKMLSKFKTVNVALSPNKTEDRNPLSVEDRTKILSSVYENINIAGLKPSIVFGAYHQDANIELRETFGITDNAPLVLVVGKEDNRYHQLKERSSYFDIHRGIPSEDYTKCMGLYGIDLLMSESDIKVSASVVRKSIREGNDLLAKSQMLGDDELKEIMINKIRTSK